MAISYDTSEVQRRFALKRGIDFTLLSDPGSATIDAWGVRNARASGRTAGIPVPGLFVLDPDGVVRAKLFERDVRERPSPDRLIEAVRALGAAPGAGD